MLSLQYTIQTMQFDIQQKEQNRLIHYLSIYLTVQAKEDCSERSIFYPINLNLFKALMLVKLCQYNIT